MERLQKELDRKAQEVVEAKKKVGELAAKKQIDDQLLNKQVEDIKKLKSQIKKIESGGGNNMMNSNPSPYSQGKANAPSS